MALICEESKIQMEQLRGFVGEMLGDLRVFFRNNVLLTFGLGSVFGFLLALNRPFHALALIARELAGMSTAHVVGITFIALFYFVFKWTQLENPDTDKLLFDLKTIVEHRFRIREAADQFKNNNYANSLEQMCLYLEAIAHIDVRLRRLDRHFISNLQNYYDHLRPSKNDKIVKRINRLVPSFPDLNNIFDH